jgi:hypothetical protein
MMIPHIYPPAGADELFPASRAHSSFICPSSETSKIHLLFFPSASFRRSNRHSRDSGAEKSDGRMKDREKTGDGRYEQAAGQRRSGLTLAVPETPGNSRKLDSHLK